MKSLLHLLGAMLVHQNFREAMIADFEATLISHNFDLSSHDKEIALNIVKSFEDDEMEDAVENVRAECPSWPCNDSSMTA